MYEEVTTRVWEIAEPVAASEGLEIFDIEYRRERSGMVLRLFVDRREGHGVTLDELTVISRQLSDLLDVHDVVPGAYVLEVSSPGINRRLRRPEHFRRYLGARVRVKVSVPIAGRKAFTGELTGVDLRSISVREGETETQIPFDQIAQANLESDPAWPEGMRAHEGKGKR